MKKFIGYSKRAVSITRRVRKEIRTVLPREALNFIKTIYFGFLLDALYFLDALYTFNHL